MPPKRRNVQANAVLRFRRTRLVHQLDSLDGWLQHRGATTPNRDALRDQAANFRQAVLALDMPKRREPCMKIVPLGTLMRRQTRQLQALRQLRENFRKYKGTKEHHRVQLNTFVRVALADAALSERRLEQLARTWTLDDEEEAVVGRSIIGSIRNGVVELLLRRQRENLRARIAQYSATHCGLVRVIVLHVHDEALLRLKSYDSEPGGSNRPRP
jgi:hypothetical protein